MQATALPSPKSSTPVGQRRDHATRERKIVFRDGPSRLARRLRQHGRRRVVSDMLESWLAATRGRTKEIKEYKNAKGAAKMWDMAMRVVMVNLKDLQREHFEGVPWMLARKMWEMFEKKSVLALIKTVVQRPLLTPQVISCR
jgi:hypothetical protein